MERVTEADKALWTIFCVQYTAEELGISVKETARLLKKHGLLEHMLTHYGVLHTQGYEYMAEELADLLQKAKTNENEEST